MPCSSMMGSTDSIGSADRRAQVGVEHRFVGLNLGRGAAGDHLAEVQHDDPSTHPHHQRHVVLDHQDRHAVGGQLQQKLAEALGLGLVLA